MSFSENPVLQGLAAESDNFADPDADAISVVAMSDSEEEDNPNDDANDDYGGGGGEGGDGDGDAEMNSPIISPTLSRRDDNHLLSPTPSSHPDAANAAVDASLFVGPVAVILDVAYLTSEFTIPSDASFSPFEDALSAKCGGGTICARFACDLEPDGEPLPARQRLHAALRQHGYELLLSSPRPLTGARGTTDLEMACCIMDSSKAPVQPAVGRRERASVLALVAGDADFSSVLGRVLIPAPPAPPPAAEDGSTSDAPPPTPEAASSSSSADGLRACVYVSERGDRGQINGVAIRAEAIKHVDLLNVLPSLVPSIDLREATMRRDRRRDAQRNANAKVSQKEKVAETKRLAKEEEKAAKRRQKMAEDEVHACGRSTLIQQQHSHHLTTSPLPPFLSLRTGEARDEAKGDRGEEAKEGGGEGGYQAGKGGDTLRHSEGQMEGPRLKEGIRGGPACRGATDAWRLRFGV